MKIDSYNFGEIVIDGKKYTEDVVIFPERVNSSWWRKEGHRFSLEDFSQVLKEAPAVIVAGTGASGLVEVAPELREYLETQSIELIAEPTEKACQIYNELSSEKKVIGCFHLTC